MSQEERIIKIEKFKKLINNNIMLYFVWKIKNILEGSKLCTRCSKNKSKSKILGRCYRYRRQGCPNHIKEP
jgi:hypothetical protein